jgi:zinc/manganese transport system permease protein
MPGEAVSSLGLGGLLSYPFMVNALRAGTIVAVVSAAMGWFMVLRRQTFAGHTLSLVGFPGAAGAILLGISPAFGYFGFCAMAALVIGAADPRAGTTAYRQESALIGTVQAMSLAAGFLFVSLYHGNLTGLTGLLFGSFLGITAGQVMTLLAVAAGALVALGLIARPLLLASIDPDVAAAAGLPVRALSVGFLLLLGVAVAETAQITGALLVFALLVLPPATAQVITGRPGLGVGLSVALAVGVTWAGLAAAYYTPYPTGAFITTFSFGAYAVTRVVRAARDRPWFLRPATVGEPS